MVSAIGTPAAATAPARSASRHGTSDLDAKLNTYRAQLGDWVTCPSAKTPAGKAKIKQISAKFEAVKTEIARASAATAQPAAIDADATRGRRVDVYA